MVTSSRSAISLNEMSFSFMYLRSFMLAPSLSWQGVNIQGKDSAMPYVSLDGYIVHRARTEKAVAITKAGNLAQRLVWIPRSMLEDPNPDELDTDICVEQWFADREGLDY